MLVVSQSGDQKTKIKVSAELVPSETWEARTCPRLPPSLVSGHLLLVSLLIVFPLCVSVPVSQFPPLIRTPVTWIRTHPNDLILAWLPLWRPYSKYGHILKYQGLGFHHIYIYIYTCTFGKSQDLTNTLDGFRVGLLRLMGFPKLQTLPKWCQSLDLAPASEYKECGLGCGGHSKHMTWE